MILRGWPAPDPVCLASGLVGSDPLQASNPSRIGAPPALPGVQPVQAAASGRWRATGCPSFGLVGLCLINARGKEFGMRPVRSRGFTLIELLVVIAIIAC